MLDSEFIKQLKQTNISIDSEKTAQRVNELWKSAKNAQKRAVTELTGGGLAPIYRIYNTGHISAKLGLPLAQVLGVSPFYLSAETDDPGSFDEDTLREFLKTHGYDDLAQGLEPQKRPSASRTRRAKPIATEPEQADAEEPKVELEPELEVFILEAEDETPAPEFAVELDDSDILTLIHSLRLRAACGVTEAAAGLKKLYAILLG